MKMDCFQPVASFKLRGMGRDNMREFMRIAALPARDLMDEFFENEIQQVEIGDNRAAGDREERAEQHPGERSEEDEGQALVDEIGTEERSPGPAQLRDHLSQCPTIL